MGVTPVQNDRASSRNTSCAAYMLPKRRAENQNCPKCIAAFTPNPRAYVHRGFIHQEKRRRIMNKEELSKKLNTSKEKLQLHLERFNSLREEGKTQEALEELKIALSFAAQTLEYSNSILQEIHTDLTSMPQETRQKTLQAIETNCTRTRKIRSENPLLNIHVPEKKTLH